METDRRPDSSDMDSVKLCGAGILRYKIGRLRCVRPLIEQPFRKAVKDAVSGADNGLLVTAHVPGKSNAEAQNLSSSDDK